MSHGVCCGRAMFTKQVSCPVDSLDPHRGCGGAVGRANSKKDLSRARATTAEADTVLYAHAWGDGDRTHLANAKGGQPDGLMKDRDARRPGGDTTYKRRVERPGPSERARLRVVQVNGCPRLTHGRTPPVGSQCRVECDRRVRARQQVGQQEVP